MKNTTILLFTTLCLWAQPQSPSALQAVTATNKAVTLVWTGSDPNAATYSIERRGLSDTVYVAIGSATTAGYQDAAIDPMATYVYRVRAVDAAANASGPSNEITIGPPPVGVSLVSPFRSSLNLYDESQFGIRPLMTLDANGDPAVVYSIASPNNTDGSDQSANSFLEFVSWDRTQYAWKPPVSVGLLGNGAPSGGGSNNYSFGRDATNNTWAVATLVIAPDGSSTEVRVYVSKDNGATWNPISAFTDATYALYNVSVALGGGNIYLSVYQDYNGIRYFTGKLSDPPSKWASSIAPLPAGAQYYRAENHLALDAAGKPGIAFFASDGSYNSILCFWRPGDAASSYLLDSNNIQNDYVEVKLAFAGTQARVAAQLVRDDQGPSGYDRFFWVTAQQGSGFLAPVGLPSDGNSDLAWGSFAIGSAGQAALVTARTGGNYDGVQCGNPKLSLSSDLVNWTTCSPYPMANEPYQKSDYPQVTFASNDGLYIAMLNLDDQNTPLFGVIFWRQ